MGLSASQAKLLSITSRISDNELRSQTITSAKMALANQSTAASKDYVNALNTTKLTYSTYDLNGNKAYVNLTGSQLSQYAPLKNQYALINNKGQVLVSEADAKNYDDSADMEEFLAKYGIEKTDSGKTQTVANPEYQPAYEKWKAAHDEWVKNEPDKQIKVGEKEKTPAWDETVSEAWTERVHKSEVYQQVMQTGCMSGALDNTNCYMHVLASLLGEGHYTTSSGDEYDVFQDACDDHKASWCWNTDRHPISETLRDELKRLHPCGETHDESVDMKYDSSIYHVNCKDDKCDSTISVYQKIIDLLWDVHNDYNIGSSTGGDANPENIAKFWHLIEFDLDEATKVEHEAEVMHHDAVMEDVMGDNPAYEEWVKSEPKMEEIPATITEKVYTYGDGDQAQWYVNLWHRMNGASTDKDGMQTTTTTNTTIGEDGKLVVDKKETTQSRWDILEDGLMNSADWLQYALESGAITLERANFENPTEKGTGLANVKWTSIIYTNALDISEETDEAAITKAEAEYESKTKDIEAKDKQYDNMLKLLDTEHSALQSEYDSVKTIISKNTERTLKMYSA